MLATNYRKTCTAAPVAVAIVSHQGFVSPT